MAASDTPSWEFAVCRKLRRKTHTHVDNKDHQNQIVDFKIITDQVCINKLEFHLLITSDPNIAHLEMLTFLCGFYG